MVSVVVMTKADERLMKVKEALLCERRTRAKHLQGKTFRAGGRRKISKRIHPFALHQVAYVGYCVVSGTSNSPIWVTNSESGY